MSLEKDDVPLVILLDGYRPVDIMLLLQSKGQGHKLRNVQSNFYGSNIFGTMEICSRNELIKAPGQEANSANLEKYNSIFLHNVC